MVTQRISLTAARSSEGLLFLSSSLNPIFVNRAAAEILSYPQKPETQQNLNDFLANKIRSTLFADRDSRVSAPVATFQSGRRVYQCRLYQVNALPKGDAEASLAVLLARDPGGSIPIVQVSEKFHLTNREQEVFQYLSDGLTTKEIALGMEISPNTVKSFLRVIMLKMGVSTRSGVVGKALSARLWGNEARSFVTNLYLKEPVWGIDCLPTPHENAFDLCHTVVVEIEEKRNSPRFPWAAEIVALILSPLAGPEQPQLLLRGVAVNISSGGIGMLTDQPPSPEVVVRCEIALSDNGVLIPTLLKVRWYDKVEGEQYRFGLQFLIWFSRLFFAQKD